MNGGEKNTASGSLSVVGGGLKNAASDTMSVIGGQEKNKAAGERERKRAVVADGKENETKVGFACIDGGEKIDTLVQLVPSVVDLGIKLRRLLPLVLLVVDPKIK